MTAFLEDQGVDVDDEFPPSGYEFFDADEKKVIRAEAMAIRCQEVHQAYIDARDSANRRVTRSISVSLRSGQSHALAYEIEDDEGSSLSRSEQNTPSMLHPGWPNKLPSKALGLDSHATRQVRIHLKVIKRQAREDFTKAYEDGS